MAWTGPTLALQRIFNRSHWLPFVVAAIFGLLAWSGIHFTAGSARIAALWLANGWVLGFMLADREQRWPSFLLGAALAGAIVAVAVREHGVHGVMLVTSNCVEIAISYFALRKTVSSPTELFTAVGLSRFVRWAVVAAPLFGGLIAGATLAGVGHLEFLEILQRRFIAHALGIIVVAPLVLAVFATSKQSIKHPVPAPLDWLPYVALLVCAMAIFSQSNFLLLFLLFPPFLWVIFRHGYLGTALGIATIAVTAGVAMVAKGGPLSLSSGDELSAHALILQLLLGTLVVTAYPICGLLTRYKELLESVANREQQLRVIADNSRDIIIQTHRDGRKVYISPAIQSVLGYSPEELLSARSGSAIHPDDQATFEREQAALAAGADDAVQSYRVRHRNGHFVWVEVTAKTIRDAEGQVTGWISTTRDITERKRVEQMKEQFIATVSHELRTPVTTINGAIGLIQSGNYGSLPKSVTRLLTMAQANGERLALLINDILDLEKLSSGNMNFAAQTVAVNQLLEDAVVANEAYAAKRGVRFQLVERCEAQVQVDPHRFQQVMANLLSNAAKFSPEGKSVEVGAFQDVDNCVVYVSDHGSGIPASFQPMLFQRFSQADASDSRCRSGTGLGMAIAKELTTAMGGDITFESQEGEGTTFRLTFPTATQSLASAG